MNEMNPVSEHWHRLGLPLLAKAHDSFCQALLGPTDWTVLEDHPDEGDEISLVHETVIDGLACTFSWDIYGRFDRYAKIENGEHVADDDYLLVSDCYSVDVTLDIVHSDGQTECTTLHYGFAEGTECVLKEAERLLMIGLKRRYPDEKLLWRVPSR